MKFTNADKGRILAGFAIVALISAISFPKVVCESVQCTVAMYIVNFMFSIFIVFGLVFAFIFGLKDSDE